MTASISLHTPLAPTGPVGTGPDGTSPAPPETPPCLTSELAGDLAYDLIRVLKLMHALRDRAPRIAPGLDPTTQPLMHKLARCESTRVTDLAAELHADVSTISRYASTLAHAGLVDKTADPLDRRVQMLALTDTGREAVASLYQQRADSFARILQDWTPTEITSFRGFVNRFADDLARDLVDDPQKDPLNPRDPRDPGGPGQTGRGGVPLNVKIPTQE